MSNLRKTFKKLWADESAQGTTEYILLLVVVVAIAFTFRSTITERLKGLLGRVGDNMDKFSE